MKKPKHYSSKDEAINAELYGYFISHHADDGWDDPDKFGNFKRLITLAEKANYPLDGASVLDIGCGTGDMAGFLRKRKIGDYLGIDIFDLSIQLAKMKFPEEQFRTGDFLKLKIKQKYDFVFASGALSAILDSDNYALMEAFITKMWERSLHGIAYNFLVKRFPEEHDDTLFLYDLDRVLALCKTTIPHGTIEYELNRAGDDLEFLQAHVFITHTS